ncbi:hypothetical protein [Flavobacterium sp. PS2]|uniref:hypothetical protein n=1 Tax=Flavobacterium sp. PS2 TaxID=3384157 RepID=UPI00390C86F1
MDKEELQKLFEFLELEPFIVQIDLDTQIKYDLAFKDLQKKIKIQNRVFIDNNSFIDVINQAFDKGAKYLKIHLIKEGKDLDVNIGFSFSNSEITEDLTVDNDFDFFWTLNDKGLLIESKKKPFQHYKKNFQETTSKLISDSTNKKCTEFIKYEIEYVIRYMIRNLLSNTFDSKKFMLNFFVFKDHTADTNDRIGISVHNTLTLMEGINKKELNSIGYDFGTVYP